MKKILTQQWSLLFALCAMLLVVSCGDDDPIIIDPGTGSLNLADGTYLKADGADPVSSAGLSAEVVEANDFASQDRTGFNAGYMYLAAGSYTVVTVADKEITGTIGGTAETITDAGSDCGHNDYMLVTTSVDGPAFNVAAAGLYKVTHDQMTNELILYNIQDASIIGNATEGGWSADTPLSGSVDASGGSWTGTGLILRSGEWKVRFNCRWGVNRRIDPNGSLNDPANGYQFFTNFGGDATQLVTGGGNIAQMEDGEYTVTTAWSPQSGWSLDVERTGDAPVITFNPNDFQMAIIGDATNLADTDADGTPDGWQSDRNLFHAEDAGTHYWRGVVTFEGTGEWKIRANDNWDDLVLGGDAANPSAGGDNMATPGAGAYYIVLSTADEGDTWSLSATAGGWGLIGDGSPAGGWGDNDDVELVAMGNVDGVSTYVATGDFTTAEWKFRANGGWDHNLGGMLTFLEINGGNISLGMDGTYTATLSFNGEVYSATVQ